MRRAKAYFKLWHHDWLNSESIVDMTAEQEGIYFRCLALQAQLGSIPDDTQKLALLLRRPHDVVARAWEVVKTNFKPDNTTVGRLYNERLEAVIADINAREKKLSLRSKKGATTRSRVDHESITSRALRASGYGYESGYESESVLKDEKVAPEKRRTKTDSVLSVSALLSFEKFWAAYPKRKARGDAENAWNKIRPDENLLARILAAVEAQKQSADWRKEAGQFIPHPATWLNRKGWEDDAGAPSGINPLPPANRGGYNPNQPGFIKSNPTPATAEQLAEVEALQKEMQY